MKKFVLIILSVMIISCNKDVETIAFKNNTETYSVHQKNEMISSYAQILAASLNNTDLRNLIKSEADIQFDGDYDILTSHLHKKTFSLENVSVKSHLINNGIFTRSNENGFHGNLNELLTVIQKEFPNLQISIPIHCDEWNTNDYIPLVAYLPYDFDDQVATEVEAFDVNGNVHILSLEEEPEFPIIVVSISERVDKEENILAYNLSYGIDVSTKSNLNNVDDISLIHSSSGSVFLSWTPLSSTGKYEVWRMNDNQSVFSRVATLDISENSYKDVGLTNGLKYHYKIRVVNGDEEYPFSQIITTTASERSLGEPLKLVYYQMPKATLNDVEPWILGKPEFRLRIVYGTESGIEGTQIYSGSMSPTRAHIKDGCNPNKTILPEWDPNTTGSILTFDWKEEDSKGTFTFKIGASYESKLEGGTIKPSADFTYTTNLGDDVIGATHVYWWSPKSTNFDVGIKWKLE